MAVAATSTGIMAGVLAGIFVSLTGCDSPGPLTAQSLASGPRSQDTAPPDCQIICQGTLEPAGGMLSVQAPPGDRVASVLVEVGQRVTAGDPLLRLQSRQARELEVQIAESKLRQAERQVQAQRTAGEASIRVARLKTQQATQQLERAKARLEEAQGPGGRLDVLRQAAQLSSEKLDRLRTASGAGGPRIASEATLADEQLRVTNAKLAYQAAVDEAQDAVQDAGRELETAEGEIAAAEAQLAATAAGDPSESLRRAVELSRLQLNETEPVAAIDATVLDILTGPGAATTGMPLMRLADTETMIVIAEVNAADLPLVARGDNATVHSEALGGVLTGTVTAISPVIAVPSLPSPVPTDPIDRFTGEVTIELTDPGAAARLVGLQVEVCIGPSESAESSQPTGPSQTTESTKSATSAGDADPAAAVVQRTP